MRKLREKVLTFSIRADNAAGGRFPGDEAPGKRLGALATARRFKSTKNEGGKGGGHKNDASRRINLVNSKNPRDLPATKRRDVTKLSVKEKKSIPGTRTRLPTNEVVAFRHPKGKRGGRGIY